MFSRYFIFPFKNSVLVSSVLPGLIKKLWILRIAGSLLLLRIWTIAFIHSYIYQWTLIHGTDRVAHNHLYSEETENKFLMGKVESLSSRNSPEVHAWSWKSILNCHDLQLLLRHQATFKNCTYVLATCQIIKFKTDFRFTWRSSRAEVFCKKKCF